MRRIVQSIHKLERIFDTKAEWLAFHHPYLAFFTVFVGMPIVVLAAVCVCTTIVILPVSWFAGWI